MAVRILQRFRKLGQVSLHITYRKGTSTTYLSFILATRKQSMRKICKYMEFKFISIKIHQLHECCFLILVYCSCFENWLYRRALM